MSDDTYFFEVSVAEHPQTKKRMNDLAKSVIDAQTAMSGAVSLVGLAAEKSVQGLDSMLGVFGNFSTDAQSSIKAVQDEIRSLQELSRQKIVQTIEITRKDAGVVADGIAVTESASPVNAPASRMPNTIGADPSDYTERLRKSQTEERSILDQKVKDHASANGKIANGVQVVSDALDAVRSDASKPIIQQVEVKTTSNGSVKSDPSSYTEALHDAQIRERSIWEQKAKDAKSSLDDIRDSASKPIIQDVVVKTTRSDVPSLSVPTSQGQSTSGLDDYSDALMDSHIKDKAVWEAKVETQKKAFMEASEAYDKAVETQHKSADEMNKAALKGARGLLDAAKGMAQLGIVSEENSEKLVKSLVVIEGAFNIAKGGIEFLEAFGQGWKAVKSSQEAANNISKITASLRSAEFAQLRAYHVALVQEAEAASLTAAANGRLAASRTAAAGAAGRGAAVGAVGSVATGAATSAAGSAVGGAVGGAAVGGGGAVAAGAAWNTLGGVALGGAATIGAFVAAVAGAGFGLRALYDVATGAGKSVGSFNDTIATWEAGVGASMLSMTGMFTSLDDPSTKFVQNLAAMTDSAGLSATGFGFLTGILGDFATAAASNAELRKAEKNAVKLRADVDFRDANENTKRDGGNQVARAMFENRNQIRSIDAGDSKESQLAAATQKRVDAAKELAAQTAIMARLESQRLQGTEEYADAEREAVHYRKELTDAIQKQQQLSRDVVHDEIEGQKKIQDATSKRIEEAKKGMEDLENKQQSAVENFAKMGKLEQTQAVNALNKARSEGGASLNDKEKELLRSVGTDEAKQLATEGDRKEAADSGFNESFGSNFDEERQAIENTRQQLEAELSMSYDYTIDIKSDKDAMVEALAEAARVAVRDENKQVVDAVNKRMAEEAAKARQERDQQLRTRNKNGG